MAGGGWARGAVQGTTARRTRALKSYAKRILLDTYRIIGIAPIFRVIGVLATAPVHSCLGKCLSELSLLRQRGGSHCGNRAGRAVRHFPHDPLDGMSAAAALGAAAEAVIDLTHPQPLRRVRKPGPKLMVSEHIARADDHGFVLAGISGRGRDGENQNRATTPSRHESYGVPSGHISAACSSCLACCGVPNVSSLRRQRSNRMAEPRLMQSSIGRQSIEGP